jgi:hypothetical protein
MVLKMEALYSPGMLVNYSSGYWTVFGRYPVQISSKLQAILINIE